MQSSHWMSLLADARASLRSVRLIPWRMRTRHHLLERLDEVLAVSERSAHPAIAIARKMLTGQRAVRIDRDECIVEEEATGYWVRGWIWVAGVDVESVDHLLTRFREALAKLPERARYVFEAHCVEDLPYDVIARRLGIEVAEVEKAFASALVVLSSTLDDDQPPRAGSEHHGPST